MDTQFVADSIARNQFYGVNESNPMPSADYHSQVSYEDEMSLGEFAKAGGRITRLRILGGGPSDGFYADISYCHGVLPSGKVVPIRQDFPMGFQIRRAKAELISWAKEHGVFAKGIGLLDEGNWSVLR